MRIEFEYSATDSAHLDLLLSDYLQSHRVALLRTTFPPWCLLTQAGGRERASSAPVALSSPVAFAGGFSDRGSLGSGSASSSHAPSSDESGWISGQAHQAGSRTNTDGSTGIDGETTTRGDCALNSADCETRTFVKGTDNSVRETRTGP